MKKLLKKKRDGNGDLLVSLVAILGITLVTFLYLHALADVQIRIGLDQVARKYILIMETEGGLSSENCSALKTEAKAVSQYIHDVNVDFTNSTGYGTPVSLTITCKASTTGRKTEDGKVTDITTREGTSIYTVKKQSTAKY